jgi:sugar phosphate isomerase/epimerase
VLQIIASKSRNGKKLIKFATIIKSPAMTTRRSFLKTTALVSTGLLIGPDLFALAKQRQIGTQLYTVRELMAKDPVGTLAKVAKIGFNTVEGATYTGTELFYGMPPKQFKSVLSEYGLEMPSAHYVLGESMPKTKGTLSNDWQKAVDDAAEVGLKYMVCAYLSDSERGTLENYKSTAVKLNIAGQISKNAGIKLCYHNHNFEFVPQGDQLPYDVLLTHTDPDLVQMEMDIYWVYKAKQDPIALFKKYPGRFPLWHVKDMDNTPEQKFTEVGNGVIPFKEIFTHAKEAGLKYFFNEQDVTPGDPLVSMEKSYKYIKQNLA